MPLDIHIVQHLEAGRILSAFSAVALASDSVHRHGQHLMGLTGKRTEAHAAGAETGAEALHTLHLIEGQGRLRQLELQQIAQRRYRAVLQQGFIGGEMVVTRSGLYRRMQRLRHLGSVEVVFTTGAVLHKSHELELAAIQLWEGLGVERQRLVGQLHQGHAGDTAGRAAEGGVDHISTKADRLKNLSAVIAGKQ